MVPLDPTSLATFLAIGLAVIFTGATIYGLPGKPVKERIEDASKLILSLLSYPLCVLVITAQFMCLYLGTIVSYTMRRVGGKQTTQFNLKASFGD
jgi:hypothetical protein